jgi:hypothetical protein
MEELDAGCRMRLLITDPFCAAKAVRNRLDNVTTMIDPKLDLANLRRLVARYPNLAVRFTDEIYCSVFFTDRDMIYDPYHLGQVHDRLENQFFALQLVDAASAGNVSCFRQLKNHFEFLWRTGVPWNEFIRAHRRELAYYLGES